MNVDWNAEQVDFSLQMIINKYNAEPKSVKISCGEYGEEKTVVIVKTNDVAIKIKSRYEVYLYLKGVSGEFQCSYIPFVDGTVKKKIRFFRNIAFNIAKEEKRLRIQEQEKNNREQTMKALIDTFPEAINEEFEKEFFGKKGK